MDTFLSVQRWDLLHLEVPDGTRDPIVLHSDNGARVLIPLAPWPGEGHYRGSD